MLHRTHIIDSLSKVRTFNSSTGVVGGGGGRSINSATTTSTTTTAESSIKYTEYQNLSKSIRPIIHEIEKRADNDSIIELLVECQGIINI